MKKNKNLLVFTQRNAPIPVWGEATPREKITLTFKNIKR